MGQKCKCLRFKAKYFVFVRNWLKAPGIPCSHMASSIQTPYVALLRPWLPFHSTVLYNDHILLVYCKPLSLQHSASMDDIQSLTSSSSPHTFQSHDLVMKCKAPFLCSASSVVQAIESDLTTYSIGIICHGRLHFTSYLQINKKCACSGTDFHNGFWERCWISRNQLKLWINKCYKVCLRCIQIE